MNKNDFRAAAYLKHASDGKSVKEDWTSGLQHYTKDTAQTNSQSQQQQPQAQQTKSQSFLQNQINSQPFSSSSVTSRRMQAEREEKARAAASIADTKRRLNNATDFLKSGGLIKVPEAPKDADGRESVYRRVAKFLLIIGEEEAAKVLPHLSEKQIEKIIPEIASIRSLSNEEKSVILEEFNGLLQQAKTEGGLETARDMLEKAYGKKRAEELIKKTMPLQGQTPFSYLNDMENEHVYQLLKGENVGVQSIVLSHLEPKKAAGIINNMQADEKKEVVLRLAKMEAVSPEIIQRLDQAMHEKSLHLEIDDSENIDGRNALAQILKKMDLSAEHDILSYLSDEDPDLGQDLRSRLFTIDDVVNADDHFIQKQLAEMTEADIARLIAAKPDDFQEKILSNISAGRRAEVREQTEILRPMRRGDCEAITQTFFGKLRRAYEAGNLYVKNRDDEEYVL